MEFEAGSDLDEKPEKKQRKPRKKTAKSSAPISAEECTMRLYQGYQIFGKATGSSATREKSEFKEEGAMLSRMSEKFPIVALILNFLDPIFFILAIFTKYSDHWSIVRERRNNRKREREEAKAAGAETAVYANGTGNWTGTETHYTS